MKNLILMAGVLLAQITFAQEFIGPDILFGGEVRGHDSRNGGDTTCEMEFVRVSETIKNWINDGGGDNLDFSGTSGENGLSYKNKMYLAMGSGTVLSCTNDQSKVKIGDSDKACINYKEETGLNRILCHRETFENLSEEAKHLTAHHEIAGVAGLEINDGREASQYVLTSQLKLRYSEVLVGRISIYPDAGDVAFFPTCQRSDSVTSSLEEATGKACSLINESDLLEITELKLTGPRFKNYDLQGLTNLKKLIISKKTRNLTSSVLKPLVSLDHLVLHDVLYNEQIDEDLFIYSGTIETLVFVDCTFKDSVIPAKLLYPLSELDFLYIRESDFHVLDNNFFVKNKKISDIALDYSKIIHLQKELFSGLNKLVKLNLWRTGLSTIEVGALDNILKNNGYVEMIGSRVDFSKAFFDALEKVVSPDLGKSSINMSRSCGSAPSTPYVRNHSYGFGCGVEYQNSDIDSHRYEYDHLINL